MRHLSITLFGAPTVHLDGRSIYIRRRKALALLVYLATSQTTQTRDDLSALLWPDQPQKQARGNLRRALFSLHRLLGDDTPNVEGDTVRLPIGPDVEVDVVEFRRVVASLRRAPNNDSAQLHMHLTELECTAALYQEDFARGLSLSDCPEFEVWHRNQTESLRTDLALVLTTLVEGYTRLKALEPAIQHARRLLALDPYCEEALQLLMRLYARTGQAAAAIRLYEHHVGLLAQELDLLPSQETQYLCRQVRDGSFVIPWTRPEGVAVIPADSPEQLSAPRSRRGERDSTPCVAQEHALRQLADFLGATMAGNGQIVFVIGEAGSGKTTLIDEFTRLARLHHPDLMVATGACTTFAGAGEPFHPFAEILQQLTCLAANVGATSGADGALIHDVYTDVFQRIAAQRPFLLILDDLQSIAAVLASHFGKAEALEKASEYQ